MSDPCERWQDAISALADGEDPGIDAALIDAHLRGCATCRTYADDIAATRSACRVSAAPAMPDLSARLVHAAAATDRASWPVARGLLVVVALQIIVFSAPALILGDDADATSHGARHLGAFTTAYAVGLLYVAARPARARTLLPTAAVLAPALVVSALVGIIDGATSPMAEVAHVPEILSLPLLWHLTRPPTTPTPIAARPSLRLARSPADRDQKAG